MAQCFKIDKKCISFYRLKNFTFVVPTLQKYSKHMFMLLYMLVSEDFCIKEIDPAE